MEASPRFTLVETTPESEPDTGEEQLELPSTPPADPLAESGDPLEVPGYGAAEPEAGAAVDEIPGDPIVEEPEEPGEIDATLDALDAGVAPAAASYPPEYAEAVEDIQAHVQAFDNLLQYGDPYKSGVDRVRLFNEIEKRVSAAGWDVEQFWDEWQKDRPYLNGAAPQTPAQPNPIESALDAKLAPVMSYIEDQRQREAAMEHADALHATMQSDTQAFVTDLQRRNLKVPDEAVMMKAIQDTGLMESDAPWSKVLSAAHNLILSRDPTLRAPAGMIGRHLRDPRMTVTIPVGTTNTTIPLRDQDPLTGGAL